MLPDGVQAFGSGTVQVTVRLRPITATRTFEAGLVLVGERPDRRYELSTDRVLVTIGGSLADLDRLRIDEPDADVDVTGLEPGTHAVAVSANLTTGLTLVGASPNPVEVTVSSPAAVNGTRRARRRHPTPASAHRTRGNDQPVPRLFGTDGIRGVANVDLKPTTAFALGRATAHRLVGPGGSIVVGQDTRRSGDMFVAAIAAGATSLGVDVHIVGRRADAGARVPRGGGRRRRRDHGLGLAQPGRGQRPQGPRRRTG